MIVSIDWDFFPYNGENDLVKMRHPQTGEEVEVSGLFLYDWGHSEAWSEEFQDTLWTGRASGFARGGLDIEKEATIRPDRGSALPDEFVWALGRRLRLPDEGVPVYIADSHAWASFVCELFPGEAVLNFDAHHDLGYGSFDSQTKAIVEGRVDCGDWAGYALARSLATSYTVVYPDWKGETEWEQADPPPRSSSAAVWSRWLLAEPPEEEVSSIFLCRSSSWTPPYLDRGFADLALRLSATYGIGPSPVCLDCEEEQKIGPYNVCSPREYDREAVAEHVEAVERFLAEQRS